MGINWVLVLAGYNVRLPVTGHLVFRAVSPQSGIHINEALMSFFTLKGMLLILFSLSLYYECPIIGVDRKKNSGVEWWSFSRIVNKEHRDVYGYYNTCFATVTEARLKLQLNPRLLRFEIFSF